MAFRRTELVSTFLQVSFLQQRLSPGHCTDATSTQQVGDLPSKRSVDACLQQPSQSKQACHSLVNSLHNDSKVAAISQQQQAAAAVMQSIHLSAE